MRILLITPRYYPESFSITRIAEQLVKIGHDVTVLTGLPNYGRWNLYPDFEVKNNEMHNGVKIIRIKERIRKKGILSLSLNYLSIYFGFKKALKKMDCNYDIVFSHLLSPILTLSYVGKFCKKHNIPHFMYGLDLWPESLIATGYCKRNSLLFKIFKKISIKVYNTCDVISFASPSVKKYIHDYLGVKKEFVHIYQPCLTVKPDVDCIIKKDYKKNNVINLIYCGTIARFIHLDLIIEALNCSKLKGKFIFNIVGSGSDMEKIKNLVCKYQLENDVIFHGRVKPEETKKFYLESDVCFVPLFQNSATSKMIPQKLIECLMYGRPIYGMIDGDGKDIIKKASNDNFISGQTVDEIRETLIDISNTNAHILEKCGRENRMYFDSEKGFTLEEVCKQIEFEMLKLLDSERIVK